MLGLVGRAFLLSELVYHLTSSTSWEIFSQKGHSIMMAPVFLSKERFSRLGVPPQLGHLIWLMSKSRGRSTRVSMITRSGWRCAR